MRNLLTLVLTLILWGTATADPADPAAMADPAAPATAADTMSCRVAPSADDDFTVGYCEGGVSDPYTDFGIAVFRVDHFIPAPPWVQWSDHRCTINTQFCKVKIPANTSKKMTASVWLPGAPGPVEVSATALFYNGK
jgi:hypothetical protein